MLKTVFLNLLLVLTPNKVLATKGTSFLTLTSFNGYQFRMCPQYFLVIALYSTLLVL